MRGPKHGLKHSAMAAWAAIALMIAPAPDARGATISEADAARFLTQATFGPTPADVARVQALGYAGWLDEQFAMPQQAPSHQSYWDMRHAAIIAVNPKSRAGPGELVHSFWAHALNGQDQLRQRVAFALSEIFVVSWADNCADNNSRGASSYLDMLGREAFGKYRGLIESVSLHPVMGCYLSHLRNQREDDSTGRVPDENFARELMQLFSIGLYELNPDGSLSLDSMGRPTETYGPLDISGLAKVMTGWSWNCPTWPSDACFLWGEGTNDGASTARQYVSNMKPYVKFHSRSEKQFLGKRIASQPFFPDPEGDLRIALDTIANHPNVGPFLGRQLIQRLVTSNPSPPYIARVAAAFQQSQGSLQSTIRAILLDPEARNTASAQASPTYGKVREPILRLSALFRGIGATSKTGSYLLPATDDPGKSLNQAPLKAPSVFNFFRPGYVPPGSATAAQGLVAPEMQLLHETSAAGYVNFIRDLLFAGLGAWGYDNTERVNDVQLDFNLNAEHPLLKQADQPTELVETLNQRLMYGTMPYRLRSEIVKTIGSIDFRLPPNTTEAQVRDTRMTRLRSAILLTMASPSFIVQK